MPGMNEKLRAPPDFDGPIKDRKCTDIPFTLLIIALWVAMTVVGITSIQEVNFRFVNKLLASTNLSSRVCVYPVLPGLCKPLEPSTGIAALP